MQINPSKCGIMVVVPDGCEKKRVRWEKWFRRTENGLCQGQHLPIVDRYKYLGILMTNRWSIKDMITDRRARTTGALGALTPFLRLRSVAVALRAEVLRAVVMPVATYGAEVWGSAKGLVNGLQTVINRGMRLCLGFTANNTAVSVPAMQRELGIPPVHCVCAGLACRAAMKFPTVRTWIAKLLRYKAPAGSVKGTWATRVRLAYGMKAKAIADQIGFNETTVVSRVTHHEWRKEDNTLLSSTNPKVSRATKHYLRVFCHGLGVAHKMNMWQPRLERGLTAMVKMRVGGFASLDKLRRFVSGIPADGRCVCCNSGAVETVQHILVACREWAPQRALHLKRAIDECVRLLHSFPMHRPADEGNVCIMLLGGAVEGVALPGFAWKRAPYTLASWRVGAGEEVDYQPPPPWCMSLIHDAEAWSTHVAVFLDNILPLRGKRIKEHVKAQCSVVN